MKKAVIALTVLAGVIVGASTTPAAAAPKARIVYLDELDVRLSSCGWRSTRKNKSVGGAPLKIAGKPYKRGVGTHAHGIFRVKLDGKTTRFTAMVGIDSESGNNGSAEFQVIVNKKIIWKSGVMKGGQAAKPVEVNLTGAKMVDLVVTTGGNDYGSDHTDWADAKFEVLGKAPKAVRAPGTVRRRARSRNHRWPPADQVLNIHSLQPEDMHRITLWLDSNSDFFGSYENIEAQSRGEIVQPTME